MHGCVAEAGSKKKKKVGKEKERDEKTVFRVPLCALPVWARQTQDTRVDSSHKTPVIRKRRVGKVRS